MAPALVSLSQGTCHASQISVYTCLQACVYVNLGAHVNLSAYGNIYTYKESKQTTERLSLEYCPSAFFSFFEAGSLISLELVE